MPFRKVSTAEIEIEGIQRRMDGRLFKRSGKQFVITTELGTVKGALFQESLDKAIGYAALDGINVHD